MAEQNNYQDMTEWYEQDMAEQEQQDMAEEQDMDEEHVKEEGSMGTIVRGKQDPNV